MIREAVPFKHWHYEWLVDDNELPVDVGAFTRMDRPTLKLLEAHNSWTAVVDGRPVMCGGTFQMWPGRYVTWAHMTLRTRPHMLWLTQETLKVLEKLKGRVELTVRADFVPGHRWAKMLGFEIENAPGILRAYGPEGEDHISYVRFN